MLHPATHIAYTVSKANKILGLIKRSFSYRDGQLLKQLFTSLVRPHLEYGNVAWHPYYKKDVELLERAQHRAKRLVPGLSKFSYDETLQRFEKLSLEYRRVRGDVIVYKHLHGIYNVDRDDLLPYHETTRIVTRGHSLKLRKMECRGQIRANFFSMRIVNVWNSLTEDIVHLLTV